MTKQDNSKPQTGVAPVDAAASPPPLGPAPSNGPATSAAVQDRDAPRETKSSDGLIVASIVIVSAAIAVMCHSQFSLSLPISGAFGIVALAFLMLLHKQTQKSVQIEQLKAELAQSRQGVARPPRGTPRAAPPPAVTASAEARIRELSRDIGNLTPRPEDGLSGGPSPEMPVVGPVMPERAGRRPLRAAAKSTADPSIKAVPDVAPVTVAASGAEAPSAGFGAAPQGEPVREQWSFRPRNDAQASAQDAPTVANAVNGNEQVSNAPVATIEGDLELVQRKIKELADEVNAAEALRPKPQFGNTRPKGPTSPLEDSIGALKAAAKSMRGRPSLGDFVPKLEVQAFNPQTPHVPDVAASRGGQQELVIPATAERIAGSDAAPTLANPGERRAERDVAPPSLELPLPEFAAAPSPTLPPRAAALARAVEDDAMDILLGPIVTLAEHSVGHYEMTANLRSLSGETLDFDEDVFALIGGELDSQFDIARLNRAAALAARMDAREREGSLLTEFLGSSITSRAFLETFAAVYEARPRISAQFVMTFSQRAVDDFTPAAWQAVRDMHSFGFRFALDKVRHMGTDFAALQRSGFRFVRFDVQALLDGMSAPERFVPAEEILQRSTLAGLSIIATGIQDATTQKRLLDAGILLGQGPLFGAPRPVNIDNGSGSSNHSAAA